MNIAAQPSVISTKSLIAIDLVDNGEINTCTYIEWYRFKRCVITSCKNHSIKTQTGCLAIDREAPTGNKAISDAELHLFKFSADNVSTRLVSMKRKKAITRVKGILALHGFIEYLRTKFSGTSCVRMSFEREELVSLESVYPLKIKRLGFENWMWPLIVSKREYKLFANRGRGEATSFEVHDLLEIEKGRLDALKKVANAELLFQTQPIS